VTFLTPGTGKASTPAKCGLLLTVWGNPNAILGLAIKRLPRSAEKSGFPQALAFALLQYAFIYHKRGGDNPAKKDWLNLPLTRAVDLLKMTKALPRGLLGYRLEEGQPPRSLDSPV
jgi:hypothetical protein